MGCLEIESLVYIAMNVLRAHTQAVYYISHRIMITVYEMTRRGAGCCLGWEISTKNSAELAKLGGAGGGKSSANTAHITDVCEDYVHRITFVVGSLERV